MILFLKSMTNQFNTSTSSVSSHLRFQSLLINLRDITTQITLFEVKQVMCSQVFYFHSRLSMCGLTTLTSLVKKPQLPGKLIPHDVLHSQGSWQKIKKNSHLTSITIWILLTFFTTSLLMIQNLFVFKPLVYFTFPSILFDLDLFSYPQWNSWSWKENIF